MDDPIKVEYDRNDLKQILRSFKAMDDAAIAESKRMGFELAQYAVGEIKSAAKTTQEQRIGATGRASKSSKIGEFTFGYQKRAFSGGADTSRNIERSSPYGNGILAGVEFGSSRHKHFRPRTARFKGGGNSGYFINPTLRRIQPDLIDKWEQAFLRILRKGD